MSSFNNFFSSENQLKLPQNIVIAQIRSHRNWQAGIMNKFTIRRRCTHLQTLNTKPTSADTIPFYMQQFVQMETMQFTQQLVHCLLHRQQHPIDLCTIIEIN